MMKRKNIIPFAVFLVAGMGVGVYLDQRQAGLDAQRTLPGAYRAAAPLKEAKTFLPAPTIADEAAAQSGRKPVPSVAQIPAAQAAKDPSAASVKKTADDSGRRPDLAHEPINHDLARAALMLVGEDEAAEAYWIRAINDPRLSIRQRQDLIEDLNEAGLADPRNPTLDDVPLILARLNLIDSLEADALDAVNAAAFQEATKDLMNMLDKALGN